MVMMMVMIRHTIIIISYSNERQRRRFPSSSCSATLRSSYDAFVSFSVPRVCKQDLALRCIFSAQMDSSNSHKCRATEAGLINSNIESTLLRPL